MDKTHPSNRSTLIPFLSQPSIHATRFLALMLLLLLVACSRERPAAATAEANQTPAAEESAAAPTVQPTAVVAARTTILAEGELVAVQPQLALGFSSSGRLLKLHVQAGDTVAAGDLLAELDGHALREALADAELGARQAENALAQAQLALDNLLAWQPDAAAVAQAEANLAAAEARVQSAQTQDSVAGNNLTAARIRLQQAERFVAQAQEAYDTAFDPGREWELFIDDPSCRTGEQYPNCSGAPYSDIIRAEREGAENAVTSAQDELELARANYNLAAAGLQDDSALEAQASLAGAQQTLDEALAGPPAEEITAARLQVEAAELSLEQARLNREQAESALQGTRLLAPWPGTVLTIDSAPGSLVGGGAAVVTLLDATNLHFQTTNLSERDLAQVQPGQEVTVTLKAYPNDPLDGRVLRVAPQATGTIGDAATFAVIIALEKTGLALLPGMTGRVEIRG